MQNRCMATVGICFRRADAINARPRSHECVPRSIPQARYVGCCNTVPICCIASKPRRSSCLVSVTPSLNLGGLTQITPISHPGNRHSADVD